MTSLSLAAGGSQGTFYFVGTSAGTVQVTAASAPLTQASQSQTVNPAATPTQLVYTTPARTVTAGVCSLVLSVQVPVVDWLRRWSGRCATGPSPAT